MVRSREGRTACRLDPGEELAESQHWLLAWRFHSNIMSPVPSPASHNGPRRCGEFGTNRRDQPFSSEAQPPIALEARLLHRMYETLVS